MGSIVPSRFSAASNQWSELRASAAIVARLQRRIRRSRRAAPPPPTQYMTPIIIPALNSLHFDFVRPSGDHRRRVDPRSARRFDERAANRLRARAPEVMTIVHVGKLFDSSRDSIIIHD